MAPQIGRDIRFLRLSRSETATGLLELILGNEMTGFPIAGYWETCSGDRHTWPAINRPLPCAQDIRLHIL
jgi:hypothetical protein